MLCLFFSCLSTINTLHTFPSACEDRHCPAGFQAAWEQLGKLMNSRAAGTGQEERPSLPSPLRASLLGEEDTKGSSPPGSPASANRQLLRGQFPQGIKTFRCLCFSSCLLCSHSQDSTAAAAQAVAGRRGKTSLLQGWKQVLLAPQLTTEFCLL